MEYADCARVPAYEMTSDRKAWMEKFLSSKRNQSKPAPNTSLNSENNLVTEFNLMGASSLESQLERNPRAGSPASADEGPCRQTGTSDRRRRMAGGSERTKKRKLVDRTLATYHELRREFSRPAHKVKRPDLHAAKVMRERNLILRKDIIGEIEGIEVGDTFQTRAEMCVIGLNPDFMAGIGITRNYQGGVVATSVVFCDKYPDDKFSYNKNGEVEQIVYSGEGGQPSSSTEGESYSDQTPTGGNLALLRSCKLKVPIRLMRKFKEEQKYVYDGLFYISSSRYEEGKNGNMVYKFVMERISGQARLPRRLRRR